ncbi:HoxN/HupN/NixA family nickel/cobalt transporter [Mycolicibacterium mucogenicum]|uniref:Nickel/cobalt efflux system n=1 Tax=Mycolicibacterium mucogenicum DSM 44124 TaxID=1226753 RepID=A0A8H2JBJ3_MYCMU|nr:HoxN/HupN/NixA family nickel/cobalt transporter [Mycolicibacterium mucogenicum]KAB7758073.1 nickel transporter [Mycolicibacterium mucogenicum DSM 44124]QPG71501.1 HoxN/HupN/NixA family nickel/cobalt transporter [Mycolicibacterium mucogenicum DSM 44124]
MRLSLSGQDWGRLSAMFGVIAALHVIGWGTLILVVVPERHTVGGTALGIGIGLTAYTLGLRHAFDADHIAAIDNTTRKLMADNALAPHARGSRPLSVGFFFSLGHSTIVFGLALLLSLGITSIVGPLQDDSSMLHRYTGLIGAGVSGFFLYLIAAINVVVLVGILQVFMRMRRGEYDEAALEHQLNNRGFMNRILRRFTRAISKPWQMYPLGALFGLGFDTATEVALLVLAGTGASAGLPWYAILCLPVLFAAGMSLLDTIDGAFMNVAYGWALARPVRKVYYNLTITGLSVMVALVIGTIELLGLLAEELGWSGGVWAWIGGIDLNTVGFGIVGLFVVTWVVALLVWRWGRIEEKWTARLSPADG